MSKYKEKTLAQILLILHSLVTLGYGVSLLINPSTTAAFMGLRIASADGQAELFVMYLGLSGALSLWMLFGAFSEKWRMMSLLLLALTMSGITSVRLLSALVLNTGSYTFNSLLYDIPVTLAAWFIYRKMA